MTTRIQAQSLLASIVESSDDAIVAKSIDGVIQSWNAAAERTFGYTAEEVIGQHISIIIPADRLGEEVEIMARLTAGQRIEHFETVRIRRDGQPVMVSLSISPIKDANGRVIAAAKIARDITASREAEARARALAARIGETDAKFRAFFEQGALFAGIMALDGTILEANRLSWYECGYTKEQIIGRPFWEGPWWSHSTELMATIRAGTAQAAAGETFRRELPYRVGSGADRVVDLTILPITDDEGRVVLLAPTGTDITDRRQLEDHLRLLSAEMADSNRRKDTFLATLSHELRNPLAAIRNAAAVMKVAQGDEARVQRARAAMDRQIAHMVRLLDDLLDISRITADKLELKLRQVTIADVVNEAVEAARPVLDAAGLAFEVALPATPAHLRADPARLAQVLGNLLGNAAKFTAAPGAVSLTATTQDDQIRISVRDTGIGIPDHMRARVFDLFTQVGHSAGASQGGLGIGLSLVKRLVEMHGGAVQVYSEGTGHGSEFVVCLPMVRGQEPTEPAALTVDAPDTPALRIFVVDDDQDSANTLAMLLESSGHVIAVVHDGTAAMAQVAAFAPDVVLLDIGLPVISGLEVCRWMRAQPWGHAVSVIALTGLGQDHDRQETLAAGFDRHLVKPVEPAELFTALRHGPTASRPAPG